MVTASSVSQRLCCTVIAFVLSAVGEMDQAIVDRMLAPVVESAEEGDETYGAVRFSRENGAGDRYREDNGRQRRREREMRCRRSGNVSGPRDNQRRDRSASSRVCVSARVSRRRPVSCRFPECDVEVASRTNRMRHFRSVHLPWFATLHFRHSLRELESFDGLTQMWMRLLALIAEMVHQGDFSALLGYVRSQKLHGDASVNAEDMNWHELQLVQLVDRHFKSYPQSYESRPPNCEAVLVVCSVLAPLMDRLTAV